MNQGHQLFYEACCRMPLVPGTSTITVVVYVRLSVSHLHNINGLYDPRMIHHFHLSYCSNSLRATAKKHSLNNAKKLKKLVHKLKP